MSNLKGNKKELNNLAKYSAISFQMLATIGLFAFAGYKIDQYKENKTLIFTAILGIIGVVISMYQIVKQLTKKEK